MKIVGLMIASSNDDDILPEVLSRASWMDRVVVIDDEGDFDESRLVPKLIELAKNENADWYIELDADELWPDMREEIESIQNEFNVATVNIVNILDGRRQRVFKNWRRIFRNQPFDYSEMKQLHHGKIPIKKSDMKIHNTEKEVLHHSIRNPEQGLRKYENYKKIDRSGIQSSYEHIRVMAEALRTKDFSGVSWAN